MVSNDCKQNELYRFAQEIEELNKAQAESEAIAGTLSIAKATLEIVKEDLNRVKDESAKMQGILELICRVLARKTSNNAKIAKIKEVMN